MRILLVSHYFLPKHRAGVEVYTYRLAKELQKRHEVLILCREDGHFDCPLYEEDEVCEGLRVRRLYYNTPLTFETHYLNTALDPSFEKVLDEFQPEAVHIQHLERLSVSFIAQAKKHGIPVLLTLHDYWFLCPEIILLKDNDEVCLTPAYIKYCEHCSASIPLMLKMRWGIPMHVVPRGFFSEMRRRIRRLLYTASAGRGTGHISLDQLRERRTVMRHALAQCDVLLAPSQFLRQQFIRFGIDPGMILYSDYGFDSTSFCNLKRAPSSKIRFGFAGSIMHHKGVHILLDAVKQLRGDAFEVKIFGVGYDAYFEEMKKRIAQDVRVQYCGGFDNNDVASIYKQIDVLIVPSIWYENSPLVIHEAILARTPVIASNIGGIPEYVRQDYSGFLFQAGNATDLAKRMRACIASPERVEEFRKNIRPGLIKSIVDNAQELSALYQKDFALV